MTKDPELKEIQKEKLTEVMKKKFEYQQKAIELYGIKIKEGDSRTVQQIMSQAYLDFFT